MKNAAQTLDQYFLEMRWRCLSLAADLDRIQRSPESNATMSDPRLVKLREALDVLKSDASDRAERVQLIFSDKTPPPAK